VPSVAEHARSTLWLLHGAGGLRCVAGGVGWQAAVVALGSSVPPNPCWSRPPPLRFNEVALPAMMSVGQAGFACGGGWRGSA
jgi:hypothetical protein